MIRWILVLSQQHSPDDLRRKLQIQHIEEIISWDSRRILDAEGGLFKMWWGVEGWGGLSQDMGGAWKGEGGLKTTFLKSR